MTTDPDQVFEDAALVLDLALAGDGAAVADTFDAVVKRAGAEGVYEVAWCLASEMAGDGQQAGPWQLDFPGIDGADYDERWVARFVSAYLNDDEPTGEALIGAAVADGQLDSCLMMLAGSTVATLRRREG